jgi:hypothetical protein
MNFYGYGYYFDNHFKVDIVNNIFESNVVHSSTLGSNAILAMGGNFQINDNGNYNATAPEEDIWQIHSNKFHNPLSHYELSTAGISTNDNSAFKINATNNLFTLDGETNLSASLIDDRLFDDNEGLYPEVIFESSNRTSKSPSKHPSKSPSKSSGFLHLGSMLSGMLLEDEIITLDEAGSPYRSDGSLIIDGFLEILPNVTIQMDDGSSILIRKGGLSAIGTRDKPITFENHSGRWAGMVIERKLRISAGFKLLLAYNLEISYSVGIDDFNSLFTTSQWKSLVRYCPLCSDSHQIIFYKRISHVATFDAYDAMTCNFTSVDNVLGSDFGRSYNRFLPHSSHTIPLS